VPVGMDQGCNEFEHFVAIHGLFSGLEIVGIWARIGPLGIGDGGEDLDDSRVGRRRGTFSSGCFSSSGGLRCLSGIIEIHIRFVMRVRIWLAAAQNRTVGIADGLFIGGGGPGSGRGWFCGFVGFGRGS